MGQNNQIVWEFTYQYTEISHHTKCGFHQSVLPSSISKFEHGYHTSTIYFLVMLYEHHHCVPYLCQEILGVHPKDTYYLPYMYNYISEIHRYRHSYRYSYSYRYIQSIRVVFSLPAPKIMFKNNPHFHLEYLF